MKATITKLPEQGTLYQLSQPYSKYGGSHPKFEASTKITSVPTQVTDKSNRIIYVPPSGMAEPNGKWSHFQYKVVDSKSQSSYIGNVDLLPPSNVLVGSDFSTSVDDWVIRSNGANPTPVAHEASRQGSLNYFIHGGDELIDQNSGSNSDTQSWKFCAPVKFKGNHELAYGGTLEFTMLAFSGDYKHNQLNERRESVVLECATCNLGSRMRFVQRDLSFDGTETTFKIALDALPASGWAVDPFNVNVHNWASPSKCQMVEMLSSLSELCILGDHTKWYETVGLDNVAIKAGHSAKAPSLTECLCTNPGTQCTAA